MGSHKDHGAEKDTLVWRRKWNLERNKEASSKCRRVLNDKATSMVLVSEVIYALFLQDLYQVVEKQTTSKSDNDAIKYTRNNHNSPRIYSVFLRT